MLNRSQKIESVHFASALLIAAFAACNTIEGAGRDISAGGDAIADIEIASP